jgi:phosphoglycolate phosphatase
MIRSVDSVFFDVDGVLIDSLPQHLQICRDKAIEFGLSIRIPTVVEFRAMVAQGVKISPMYYFFVAVGFPHHFAQRAVKDYERDFAEKYRPQLFEAAARTLALLHRKQIRLGLVTSNTRRNVLPILGDIATFFEPSCLFFFDDEALPKPKSWFLTKGSRLMGVGPERCLYVGDQPADAAAALEAHFQFLGVTYGWGILDSDKNDTVNSVAEIPNWLERSNYVYRAS